MDSNPLDPSSPSVLALPGFRARYRSARRLAKVVTAMFVVYVGMLGMNVLLQWDLLDLAHAERAGRSISQEVLEALSVREAALLGIERFLNIWCVVTFSMWTYRVARNVVDTGGSLSFSPGWAVGCYFIPILFLWRPYQALAEVWDASDPDRRVEGARSASHGLLLSWWLVWTVLTSAVAVVVLWTQINRPDDWVTQIHVGMIANAVATLSAGLVLAVVWQLTNRQDLRAAPPVPVARVA